MLPRGAPCAGRGLRPGITKGSPLPACDAFDSENPVVLFLHDPLTSHLAMLYTIAGQDLIRDAYAAATREGYHWHEFGDSHLILPHKTDRVMV